MQAVQQGGALSGWAWHSLTQRRDFQPQGAPALRLCSKEVPPGAGHGTAQLRGVPFICKACLHSGYAAKRYPSSAWQLQDMTQPGPLPCIDICLRAACVAQCFPDRLSSWLQWQQQCAAWIPHSSKSCLQYHMQQPRSWHTSDNGPPCGLAPCRSFLYAGARPRPQPSSWACCCQCGRNKAKVLAECSPHSQDDC